MEFLEKLETEKGQILDNNILIKKSGYSIRDFFYQLYEGKTVQEILTDNPNISQEDILLCYKYAFELIGATDFEIAKKSINSSINKRKKIAQKTRTLKMPDSWKNLGNLE